MSEDITINLRFRRERTPADIRATLTRICGAGNRVRVGRQVEYATPLNALTDDMLMGPASQQIMGHVAYIAPLGRSTDIDVYFNPRETDLTECSREGDIMLMLDVRGIIDHEALYNVGSEEEQREVITKTLTDLRSFFRWAFGDHQDDLVDDAILGQLGGDMGCFASQAFVYHRDPTSWSIEAATAFAQLYSDFTYPQLRDPELTWAEPYPDCRRLLRQGLDATRSGRSLLALLERTASSRPEPAVPTRSVPFALPSPERIEAWMKHVATTAATCEVEWIHDEVVGYVEYTHLWSEMVRYDVQTWPDGAMMIGSSLGGSLAPFALSLLEQTVAPT